MVVKWTTTTAGLRLPSFTVHSNVALQAPVRVGITHFFKAPFFLKNKTRSAYFSLMETIGRRNLVTEPTIKNG